MNSGEYVRSIYMALGGVLEDDGSPATAKLVEEAGRLIWAMHDMLQQGVRVDLLPEIMEAGGVDHYLASKEAAAHSDAERDHGQPLWPTFSYPCFDCENSTHVCPDCCAPLKHGQTACGKPHVLPYPLVRTDENGYVESVETDVPVSQLLTGDSVFSESAGTWHDVRVDGQALFLKRGESWVAMSHLPRDTVFRTRRGASGRAAGALFDAFGGEVIRDARD